MTDEVVDQARAHLAGTVVYDEATLIEQLLRLAEEQEMIIGQLLKEVGPVHD